MSAEMIFEDQYNEHLKMQYFDVKLKDCVEWFGINVPVNQSKFALRRHAFDLLRFMIEQKMIEVTHFNHTVPSYNRCRIAMFKPTGRCDYVRIGMAVKP